jgi:hypothetical protein
MHYAIVVYNEEYIHINTRTQTIMKYHVLMVHKLWMMLLPQQQCSTIALKDDEKMK